MGLYLLIWNEAANLTEYLYLIYNHVYLLTANFHIF
jgi:hypothetical protein